MIIQDNTPHVDPRVYNGDSAFVIQGYSEVNSKRGTQFEAQIEFTSVTAGSAVRFSFTTNGAPVLIKSREVSGEFSNILYNVYTDASVTGGTPVTPTNMSDRNPQSTGTMLSVNPTVSSQGTLWTSQRILGNSENKVVNYGRNRGERVLKESTTYLIEITNNGQNSVTILLVDLYWYQGQIDLDIRETD